MVDTSFHRRFFRHGEIFEVDPNMKNRLLISKKMYVMMKAFYDAGGKCTTYKAFQLIDENDKEKYNIRNPNDILWFLTDRNLYITKTDETGDIAQVLNPDRKTYHGRPRKVYQLKPRVIRFIEEINGNNQH